MDEVSVENENAPGNGSDASAKAKGNPLATVAGIIAGVIAYALVKVLLSSVTGARFALAAALILRP